MALTAVFLGTFVIGTAELVVVGMLNLIAADTHKSVSTAGTVVTAYAVGVSVGGPLLTVLTVRMRRSLLLRLALAAYVAGNLLAALSAGFGMLVAARTVAGATHGLFIGVSFAVGAGLLPREHLGRAISVVFGGVTLSHVIGVPAATLIGQHWGWRAAFLAVAALGVVALAGTLVVIPRIDNVGVSDVAGQARHAFAPRVLAVLGVGFLLMCGQFAALTYLAPFLSDVTGVPDRLISLFLVVYGVANAAGTFIGGRAADRNAGRTLILANAVLILALGLLYVAGSVALVVALALCLCGLSGFGLVPSLQHRVIRLAGPGGDLAASLPASAANAGIAVGSVLGGWALADHGAGAAVIAGVLVCAVALPCTWLTASLREPASADLGRGDPISLVPEDPSAVG